MRILLDVKPIVIALFILVIVATHSQPVQSFAMTWSDTWSDILAGGPKRWKVDDVHAKEIALGHISEHASAAGEDGTPLRILCPLAGDDPFVRHAWGQGHDVTAIDIVPAALEAMRAQFDDGNWSSSQSDGGSGSGVVWKHSSGRATLFEGDVLMKRPELVRYFDAVYDKDSFGAIRIEMRPKFGERMSEFVKEGGTVYLEVKNKETGRENGPPFHVEKSDVMEHFGAYFDHVASLGEVYGLGIPGMTQTGHVLRRCALRR